MPIPLRHLTAAGVEQGKAVRYRDSRGLQGPAIPRPRSIYTAPVRRQRQLWRADQRQNRLLDFG